MTRRAGLSEQQLDEFYARDYDTIVAGVAMVVGSRDVAVEAVDEAVARAWEHARRGHEIASLGAWTRVVALNVARRGFRRQAAERRARQRLGHVPEAVAPVEIGVDAARALAQLSRRQREVVALRYLHDLSIEQIAAELRIAESTVRTMLKRAHVALARVLEMPGSPDRHDEEVPNAVDG